MFSSYTTQFIIIVLMGFALDVDVLLQIPVRNMKCLKPVFNVHRTVCKRITRILEILKMDSHASSIWANGESTFEQGNRYNPLDA